MSDQIIFDVDGPARIGRGRPRFRKEEKPRCAGTVKGGIFG